jgi:myo-inositol-1(or 4)-monophosphatase
VHFPCFRLTRTLKSQIVDRRKGAFLNDQRLRVAGRRQLNECVIACGLPHIGRGDHAELVKILKAVGN